MHYKIYKKLLEYPRPVINSYSLKHLIKKEGQAYRLFVEGSDNFLPASRHRAITFLPKLKEILN